MPDPTRDAVWDSLAPEDRAAIERGTKAYYEQWAAGRFPPYEEALSDDGGQEVLADFYRDLIGRPIALRREEKLISAAEARGREQERARLAALATDTDREAIAAVSRAASHLALCDCTPDLCEHEKTLEAETTTLLAAFAAQRERGEALRVAASALLADVRRRYPGEALRCPYMIALDAALLAAPTKGEG